MDKEDIFFIIGIILFGITFLSMGFLIGQFYGAKEVLVYKCLDGLWTRNKCGFEGDWIHVNIGNMSFQRCVDVVRHECGHELWAEICEDKNSDLCQRGQELLNNYSKKN